MSRHPLISAILLIILFVFVDQLSKYWIIQNLAVGQELPILPFLSFYHARNTGIAFSMLSSFNDLGLALITVAIITFIIYLFWQNKNESNFLSLGYLLVIGGAIGNLIDRIRLNYVTDFILCHVGNWSFAIFNVADSFITIGAAIILLHELFKLSSRNKK